MRFHPRMWDLFSSWSVLDHSGSGYWLVPTQAGSVASSEALHRQILLKKMEPVPTKLVKHRHSRRLWLPHNSEPNIPPLIVRLSPSLMTWRRCLSFQFALTLWVNQDNASDGLLTCTPHPFDLRSKESASLRCFRLNQAGWKINSWQGGGDNFHVESQSQLRGTRPLSPRAVRHWHISGRINADGLIRGKLL
jgi:hypothetical protein